MNKTALLLMGLALTLGVGVWMGLKTPSGNNESQVSPNLYGKYIGVLDWPPQAQMIDEAFSCIEAGAIGERAGETRKREINGRVYCVTQIVEAAAGSRYTQYAYATEANAKTLILTFSVRASQCENYEPEERLLCIAEQESFNIDGVVDELAQQQVKIGTQSLSEGEPRRVTLSGTYICLPHTDTTGPQTLECALGLETSDGSYYALDFNLLSQYPVDLKTGDRFSASGVFTPVESLSSNQWQKYPIKGIFSVTGSIKKF